MEEVKYKKCTGCGKELPATNEFFWKQKKGLYGLRSKCIDCEKKRGAEYRKNNKDILHNYYLKNKEHIDEKNRKNYYKNREKYLKKGKDWYYKNIDSIKEKRHESYESNRDIRLQQSREYYQKNKIRYKNNMDKRDERMGYKNIHKKIWRFIEKNQLRPECCSICGKKGNIDFHHPDYNKEYEGVFVCRSCHGRIHSGFIPCPQPVNLLELVKSK